MKVLVVNLYTDAAHAVEGSPAHVEEELLRLYPFLRSEDPDDAGNVDELIEHLNSKQVYDAAVIDQGSLSKAESPGNLHQEGENHVVSAMLGYRHDLAGALEAARFLTGGGVRTPEQVRQGLWEADGEVEEGALLAYGLDPSEANLRALRAVRAMTRTAKAEPQAATAQDVQPGDPDASEAAEEVERAFTDRFVMPVELGGKHSKGSLLARDQDSGRVWLLKPGSGGQTPAAGAREEPASQSRREAAFWHVADLWHLGEFYPRADLLLVDGREYAAIQLLPWSFETLDKALKIDANRGRAALEPYLKDGMLHRWAVVDYVLGNPDRHANNLMIRGTDVRLIDHGSAMAGEAFDPAHDQYSFTPYYLRAWCTGRFSKMDAAAKLKGMPRISREAEVHLRAWLDGLKPEDLDKVLLRYGVNAAPAKERLSRLKMMATQMPVDLAINRAWVET